jgi:hypothetical protein
VSAPRYEPYQRLRNPLPHSFLHVCGSARCLHSFRPTCCPTVSTSKVVRPGLLDATDTPPSPSPSPCPAIRRYHALLFHLAIAGRVPSICKVYLKEGPIYPTATCSVHGWKGQQVSKRVGLRDCIRGTGTWRAISRQKTPRAVATTDIMSLGSHDLTMPSGRCGSPQESLGSVFRSLPSLPSFLPLLLNQIAQHHLKHSQS